MNIIITVYLHLAHSIHHKALRDDTA